MSETYKCEGCNQPTDIITPYCIPCQILGEIRIGMNHEEVHAARARVAPVLRSMSPQGQPPESGEGRECWVRWTDDGRAIDATRELDKGPVYLDPGEWVRMVEPPAVEEVVPALDLEAAKTAMEEAHRQLGGAMDYIRDGERDSAVSRIENAREKMEEVEAFLALLAAAPSQGVPAPQAPAVKAKGGQDHG